MGSKGNQPGQEIYRRTLPQRVVDRLLPGEMVYGGRYSARICCQEDSNNEDIWKVTTTVNIVVILRVVKILLEISNAVLVLFKSTVGVLAPLMLTVLVKAYPTV